MSTALLRALVLIPLLSACATDPISGKRELALVRWSVEEELEIGASVAPSLVAELDGPYASASVQRALASIVEEMVAHSPRAQDFEFEFRVLNSSVPNALALPGGRVFITRGLLARLSSEAEFVAVLGHELGHVERKHAMEKLSDGILLSAPAAPLRIAARTLPLVGGLLEAVAGVVGAPSALLGLRFNRTQELEADERGVYFAEAMGYDPRAMIGVLETLDAIEAEAPAGELPKLSILRTHPLGEDRINCVESAAVLLPARDDLRGDSPEFTAVLKRFREEAEVFRAHDAVRAQLEGLLARSEAPEEELQERFQMALDELLPALNALPGEPLLRILAAEFALLAGDNATAEESLLYAENIYARETPDEGHWKPPYYIGLMRSAAGLHAQAIAALEVSVARFPGSAEIRAALEAAQAAADTEGSTAAP